MLHKSHVSPIASLLSTLESFRKSKGWSRETMADEIVMAHEELGADSSTGITFEPRTGDVFRRMHTNATKIFRWFNDYDKDTNLLSVNFLPSVLAALPEKSRIEWLNNELRSLNLCVRSLDEEEAQGMDVSKILCDHIKESSEANQALAEYASSPSEEGLKRVERELAEEIELASKALNKVRNSIGKPGLSAVRVA